MMVRQDAGAGDSVFRFIDNFTQIPGFAVLKRKVLRNRVQGSVILAGLDKIELGSTVMRNACAPQRTAR